jgi:hypothetical protein
MLTSAKKRKMARVSMRAYSTSIRCNEKGDTGSTKRRLAESKVK